MRSRAVGVVNGTATAIAILIATKIIIHKFHPREGGKWPSRQPSAGSREKFVRRKIQVGEVAILGV